MPNPDQKLRAGDVVNLRATREHVVVAYADYERDRLSWLGWPYGTCGLADVDLVERCNDEQHGKTMDALEAYKAPSGDSGFDDRRANALRLYKPLVYHEEVLVVLRAQRETLRQSLEACEGAMERTKHAIAALSAKG
jgi:hypothetical protein